MKIAIVFLTTMVLAGGCGGSAPPPEDATDTIDGEKPLPPDHIPPTLEEPPAPSEPPATQSEPHEAPPAPSGE